MYIGRDQQLTKVPHRSQTIMGVGPSSVRAFSELVFTRLLLVNLKALWRARMYSYQRRVKSRIEVFDIASRSPTRLAQYDQDQSALGEDKCVKIVNETMYSDSHRGNERDPMSDRPSIATGERESE